MSETNETKMLKEKIVELERRIDEYDYILDQIETSIYWKDSEGKFLGCNEYVVKISGKSSKDEIIGKDDFESDFSWNKNALDVKSNDKKVMQECKALKFEESFVTADNELKTYISKKSPLINDQREVYGIVGIGLDITDRKRLEEKIMQQYNQLEQKDAQKTQFIENFGHDIRVPINALVGRTQFIKLFGQKEHNEKMIQAADDAQRSVMVLDTLFSQMQDIIVHEQFDEKIYNTNFSLAELVNKEVEIADASISPHKKVSINFNTPEDFKYYYVYSDYHKLSQIVRNFLSNAVKFTDDGNIDVQVEVIEKGAEDLCFKFKVSDTGIGIDKNYQKNIYEQFNRAGITSHQTNRHGMGVGLYIAKNNVEILSGKIDFESSPGQGSRFWFEVPLTLSKV